MSCTHCDRENRPDSRFCLGCGRPLASACSGCGRELPQEAAFCDGCGQAVGAAPTDRDPRSYTPKHLIDRILGAKGALEGERKQVTVLFADVRGSVRLAKQVDPEEWHGILDRFFQILADGVHRFEGTVNQYTGDGIMALFGAPIAHEDHAQRACHAALTLLGELRLYGQELRRERGLDFSVRIGINSGEVVVGKIGDDLRMDYTARGETVGLAARIEGIAEGGRAYLSEGTASLVSGFFRLDDLGEFQLKGEGTIRVFELQGPGPLRTRLDVSRARGFSRFVGRTAEMAILETALERAVRGEGQVVGVVADPGTGKSRLCLEFAESCRLRGIAVREAHALSHGSTIPLLPVRELVRGLFAVSDQESDREVRQKVAGGLLLIDAGLEEHLPLLFEFLGVPDPSRPAPSLEPEEWQRALFGVMRRVLAARDREEPTVILFEDLHWIDPASETFLEQLVETIPGARTLLVVNFRRYHAEWMQHPYYQQLALRPLGPEPLAELLRDLLGDDPSVRELPEKIRARTGGNPFFIEEVVQTLSETGSLRGARGAYRLEAPLERIEIPATVQSVLAARIDRLSDREKGLLQTASVIGRRFSEPVLSLVLRVPDGDRRAALDGLVAAEFLYPETLYPVAEYLFKHPLTHEVAYGSQLRERRARIHAEVARAIEAIDAEGREKRAALLAHHWEQAGETLEAARWHRRAAEVSGFVDVPGLLFHWGRVRHLAAECPESEEALTLRLRACWRALEAAGRAGMSTAEASDLFEEGKRLAEQADDPRALVLLHESLAARLGWSGDPDGQRLHLNEASRLMEGVSDLSAQLVVLQRSSVAEFHGGDFRKALALAQDGLDRAERDATLSADEEGSSLHRALLLAKSNVLTYLGRLDESAHLLERVDRLSHELSVTRAGRRTEHIRALIGANLSLNRGDVEPSLRRAIEFVGLAERSGSTWAEPVSALALGRALLLAERYEEAQHELERSLHRAREHRLGLEAEADQLACLARAYAGRRDPRALETAEEAIEAGQRMKTRFWELQAQLALAHVLLGRGERDSLSRVDSALDRAGALVDETGGEIARPAIWLQRAELAARREDPSARLEALRGAHDGFKAMGAAGHASYAGRLLEAAGSNGEPS
ncbi:MAG: adenylate/guanylate cyclase domain-containing protein [Myxococcota bacterium]